MGGQKCPEQVYPGAFRGGCRLYPSEVIPVIRLYSRHKYMIYEVLESHRERPVYGIGHLQVGEFYPGYGTQYHTGDTLCVHHI